jgi:hypothetical protein
MKSHKMLSMAYASLVLMLAVVFFKNAPEMKTVSWNHQESVRGLSSPEKSEAELLAEKVTGLGEEVAKLKKDIEEAKKDKEPKKMKIKDLRAFIADLEKKFPQEQIDSLFKTYDELNKNEKVDKDKMPTEEDMTSIKVGVYVDELKDLLLDKATDVAAALEEDAKEKDTRTMEEKLADLEKENASLKADLEAEECDSYETLTNLRDMLNEKLEDKYGVLAEVEAQHSPMDYMQFAMMQMFSQSMSFNPAASMFGLNYSPFSYELQTIQTMQRFGFKAPSIFDYSDQVFRLPGLDSFSNISNGRQFARDLADNSRFGFGNQAPIIINNNNSVPAYQQQREPQLFPEWNRGDGNTQIFAKGRPQSLKA